jgi:hypothetical protein
MGTKESKDILLAIKPRSSQLRFQMTQFLLSLKNPAEKYYDISMYHNNSIGADREEEAVLSHKAVIQSNLINQLKEIFKFRGAIDI